MCTDRACACAQAAAWYEVERLEVQERKVKWLEAEVEVADLLRPCA